MAKTAKRVQVRKIGHQVKTSAKGTGKKPRSARPATTPLSAGVSAAPPARGPRPDPRLPAVGTTLLKRDRGGSLRCQCTVEAEGYRYKDVVYRSLTAAARAAATDLGISPTVNGLVFWGVVTGGLTAVERLRKTSARYQEQAATASRKGTSESEREEIRRELQAHATQVGKLLAELAA